jgi:hypothetical protein
MSAEIKCSFMKEVPLANLCPHPKNTNRHPERQIKLLAEIISFQGIRHPIIVSKKSGFIVAGHGRLEAAKTLGLNSFPVDYQEFENEAQEYLFLESDNHLAELSDHDHGKMLENIKEMKISDLNFLGIPDFDTESLKMFEDDGLGALDNIPGGDNQEQTINENKEPSVCPRCNFEWQN